MTKWYDDAKKGDLDAISKAIDEGQDVNATNDDDLRRSALMYASEGGHLGVVDFLVQKGADVSLANRVSCLCKLSMHALNGVVP